MCIEHLLLSKFQGQQIDHCSWGLPVMVWRLPSKKAMSNLEIGLWGCVQREFTIPPHMCACTHTHKQHFIIYTQGILMFMWYDFCVPQRPNMPLFYLYFFDCWRIFVKGWSSFKCRWSLNNLPLNFIPTSIGWYGDEVVLSQTLESECLSLNLGSTTH